MASELSPSDTVVVPTGGRSRSRRAHVMVVVLLLATGWALWHIGQPWYSFALRPGTEVAAGQGSVVAVSAHATVSAWQLVHPAPIVAAAAGASATASPAATPSSVGGVPTTAFLLGMLALLSGLGLVLRSALLSLGALGCGWYSWLQLGALRATVESPTAGGGAAFQLTRLPAQAFYADGLLLAALLAWGIAGLVIVPKLVSSAERANKLLSSLHEPGSLEALAHSAMGKLPSALLHDPIARERESHSSL